jgi:serine/threonine protein kinase
VTLKIAGSSFINEDAAKHELNITRRLEANPSRMEFHLTRTVVDHFEVTEPDGTHLCLVFKSMREPLWIFQQRWTDGKIPPSLVNVYMKFVLQGLDYLHSECHIIHAREFGLRIILLRI